MTFKNVHFLLKLQMIILGYQTIIIEILTSSVLRRLQFLPSVDGKICKRNKQGSDCVEGIQVTAHNMA